MNKKILLICYSFPPHPGIGGRRWAKFCKYLTQKHNFTIDVINAVNFSKKTSFWCNDVVPNEAIKIYSFPFLFQKTITTPNTIFSKLLRKLINLLSNYTKYSPSFITSFPNKKIWKQLQQKINSTNYQAIIVSGDPFLFYYSSLLNRPKKCQLILDYRDLWNDHSFYSKNVSLTKKQKEFFLLAENYAVNNCDKIFSVDQHLQSKILNRITNNIPTFVFSNGFDKKDYHTEDNINSDNQLKLFFAGSISSDLNESLIRFVEVLSKHNTTAKSKIQLNFFGNFDASVNSILSKREQYSIFHNPELSYSDYLHELSKSHIGIVILSTEYINSFTTKFSDYIASDKYIISIGETGKFSEFINYYKIGSLFNHLSDTTFFTKLINDFNERRKLPVDIKNNFNVETITSKLATEISIKKTL